MYTYRNNTHNRLVVSLHPTGSINLKRGGSSLGNFILKRKYGIPLFIAAAWNIVLAAISLIDVDEHLLIFYNYKESFSDPVARSYLLGLWFAIAAFGVGYGLVAYNPERNRAFISIGVPGKILFFSVIAWLWSQGIATNTAILMASGDLIFAMFFLWFLFQTRGYGFF